MPLAIQNSQINNKALHLNSFLHLLISSDRGLTKIVFINRSMRPSNKHAWQWVREGNVAAHLRVAGKTRAAAAKSLHGDCRGPLKIDTLLVDLL